MAFDCRNSTGTALTLYSGAQTLIVLANGQLGQNIANAVTQVKLGNSSTLYNRIAGTFVNGNAYLATIVAKNVQFQADGQPIVTFG